MGILSHWIFVLLNYLKIIVSVDTTSSNVYQVLNSYPATNVQTFYFTGYTQYFQLPQNVTTVIVDVYGAGGGYYQGGNIRKSYGRGGGYGGCISSQISVIPGTILLIRAGGKGNGYNGIGGFNGGGNGTIVSQGEGEGGVIPYHRICRYYVNIISQGGGGASDIRMNENISSRLVIGGGGGGWAYCSLIGILSGGSGGGLSGNNGQNNTECVSIGGQGGMQTSGGKGGQGNASNGCLGNGGSGGSGGGGGYYGGGSGLSTGGGGGSSYTVGITFRTSDNCNFGNGRIVIYYNISS